jgi:putative oxidoreductase
MTDNNAASRFMIHLGRTLVALYFLVPGIAKFLAIDLHLGLMATHHVPYASILLPIAGIAQVSGAVLLLSNRFVRFCALGFVLYILVINVMLHDFWNFTGIIATHELQNSIKNLGILAGLLVLAGISPARKLTASTLLTSDARIQVPQRKI